MGEEDSPVLGTPSEHSHHTQGVSTDQNQGRAHLRVVIIHVLGLLRAKAGIPQQPLALRNATRFLSFSPCVGDMVPLPVLSCSGDWR